MPVDKWAWINYQIEVSFDAPQYACKVLSAGAILIGLDIIKNKLNDHLSSNEALKEYEERVSKLFGAFEKEFGQTACQSLLGFDTMKYEEYPPEKQEYIAKGSWMNYCCQYIEFIVKTLCENHLESKSGQEGR
jgi:hypothetical protein